MKEDSIFMKVNSIQQQNTNFNGGFIDSAAKFVSKHPNFIVGLAGVSAIGQKLAMSAGEGTLGPTLDIAIGHGLKKIAKEEDDRTIQSSKAQASRTLSQVIGGTITGVAIRAIFIFSSIAAFSKIGEKAGGKIASLINNNKTLNAFEISQKGSSYGKNIGGFLATITMLWTNFVFDVPLVNAINKAITDKFISKDKINEKKEAKQ